MTGFPAIGSPTQRYGSPGRKGRQGSPSKKGNQYGHNQSMPTRGSETTLTQGSWGTWNSAWDQRPETTPDTTWGHDTPSGFTNARAYYHHLEVSEALSRRPKKTNQYQPLFAPATGCVEFMPPEVWQRSGLLSPPPHTSPSRGVSQPLSPSRSHPKGSSRGGGGYAGGVSSHSLSPSRRQQFQQSPPMTPHDSIQVLPDSPPDTPRNPFDYLVTPTTLLEGVLNREPPPPPVDEAKLEEEKKNEELKLKLRPISRGVEKRNMALDISKDPAAYKREWNATPRALRGCERLAASLKKAHDQIRLDTKEKSLQNRPHVIHIPKQTGNNRRAKMSHKAGAMNSVKTPKLIVKKPIQPISQSSPAALPNINQAADPNRAAGGRGAGGGGGGGEAAGVPRTGGRASQLLEGMDVGGDRGSQHNSENGGGMSVLMALKFKSQLRKTQHNYEGGKKLSEALIAWFTVPRYKPDKMGNPDWSGIHHPEFPVKKRRTSLDPVVKDPPPKVTFRSLRNQERRKNMQAMQEVSETRARAISQEKDIWEIGRSIFATRKLESDAKDYVDNVEVTRDMVNKDWEHTLSRTHFQQVVPHKDNGVELKELYDDMDEIKTALGHNYDIVYRTYLYYAALGPSISDGAYAIDAEEYLDFLREIDIPDENSERCTLKHCKQIYDIVLFEGQSSHVEEVARRRTRGVSRSQFSEVLVRLAAAKFMTANYIPAFAHAFDRFCQKQILPRLPVEATVNPTQFRIHRLYTEEMDDFFFAYKELLLALYDYLRARSKSNLLGQHDYFHFLWMVKLIGEHTGIGKQHAKALFTWSQMAVVDEVMSHSRLIGLTFIDFLEVLARLADQLSPPTDQELVEYYNNKGAWPASKDLSWEFYSSIQKEDETFLRRRSAGMFAPKTRDVDEKMVALLEIIICELKVAFGCDYDYALIDFLLKETEEMTKEEQ